MSKNVMLKEALRLASLGLRVFPLNGKTPITSHGVLDATTEEYQIESWWERYPSANIGLAMGDGIVAVDVDTRRNGDKTLRRIVSGHKWPKTVKAKTGGGGWHFFFGVTPDMWVPNSKDEHGLGVGLEVLNRNRYVVAPPSIHPHTGSSYEWVRPPDKAECALFPDWLAELNATSRGESSWDKYTEKIKEGEGRNNHLTSLAGSLRRSGLNEGEIYDALIVRNTRVCDPPLSTKEVMRIAQSVARYKPQDIMVRATLDDTGNGERLASFVKGRAIFVPGIGWHTWSGRKWRADEDGLRIQHQAKKIAREIKNAAVDNKNNDKLFKRLYAWGMNCGSLGKINAMIKLASDDPDISTTVGQLDQGDYLLNLLNGTFDLKKGQLLEHDSQQLLTKITRVEYDPDAECPKWEAFLADVMPDPEVRQYLQRAMGYTLTGSTTEQCFFLMYGVGSNGKSTFVETIKYMLGGYSWKMASDTVMGGYRPTGAATPDLVALRGPRFVVAAESGGTSRLNETVIKDLTGQDTMQARALYKAPIEFVPKFKLWMYSNYKPLVKGMDYGIWRRIRIIPFTAVIDKPDKKLGVKLKMEIPGIFNWTLRGYHEWERYGLAEPKVIRDEVKEYQQDMDVVGQFVGDKCQIGINLAEASEDLWEAFSQWQRDLPRGEQIGRRGFFERLQGLGYHKVYQKMKGSKWKVRGFAGLSLHQ